MNVIHKSALVPYSAEQMYDLVNDIESYPKFLPWCADVQLLSKNRKSLMATIVVSKGALKQAFTTMNAMEEGQRIEMNLVEGPFKYFKGLWQFDPLESKGCEVSFHLNFEFARGLIELAFGRTFSQLANSLVDAFCQQAQERYGKS
jgi:ribosome-associated toxin RatA of RatAB toxin-antitoxin module